MKIYCTRDSKSIASYAGKDAWVLAVEGNLAGLDANFVDSNYAFYVRVISVSGDTIVCDKICSWVINHPSWCANYAEVPSSWAIQYNVTSSTHWRILKPIEVRSTREIQDMLDAADQYFYDAEE